MPDALRFKSYRGRVWRIVESQSRPSTMRIVDSLEEQAVLEQILEDTKPPVPADCAHLHYLFWSPFRYGCYPGHSRFRRRGRTPGVYYAAENVATAIAESIWGGLATFAASPGTPLPRNPVEHTAVEADIHASKAVDLTTPPLNARHADWTHPTDYSASLDLADKVRGDGGEAIRYASVRHPDAAANLAVLTCRAFAKPNPISVQTWKILLRKAGASAVCESPASGVDFHVDGHRLGWGPSG
jgi:hypothetical protein